MFNVNIYDKNWLDLVFENKNQAYGAYQLRLENPKTTVMALLAGVLFLFTVSGLGIFLSSFNDIPIPEPAPALDDTTITVVNLQQRHETKPRGPKANENPVQSPVKPTNSSHLVVAATPQAVVDVPVNQPSVNARSVQGTGTDVGSSLSGDGTGTSTISGFTGTEDKPNTTNELDHLPEYPGGIDKFYQYVSFNIDRPDYDENLHVSMLTVIMSFVIEKDGTMTDIKVMRSSDKDLEKAAIKVLKSLKTKWRPGIKDGENVRTFYMLPIKVKL